MLTYMLSIGDIQDQSVGPIYVPHTCQHTWDLYGEDFTGSPSISRKIVGLRWLEEVLPTKKKMDMEDGNR